MVVIVWLTFQPGHDSGAIREGQRNGTVETVEQTKARTAREAVHKRELNAGRRSKTLEDLDRPPSPTDFANSSELNGQYHKDRGRDGGIYGMTDGGAGLGLLPTW